mgnify:FL=1
MSKTLPARTPRFKCSERPSRRGLYETRLVFGGTSSELVLLSKWTGRRWDRQTLIDRDEWRGLVEKAK